MRPLLVVAAIAVLGLFALWHAGLTSRRTAGSAETAVARHARDWMLPAHYQSLRNPVPCNEQALNDARMHWADHCATCHANNGSGESVIGKGLFPAPPDMRATPTQGETDGALYYAIANGVPFTGMPAFGEATDGDKDSWKLVCLIRHLPSMTDEEERAMRKMNPKTEMDREEERQEQEFLNGATIPK